jgi:DMSO/TMAO reductase YedYZ heme-binding membrane subunit
MDQSNTTRNTDLLVLVGSLIVIGLSAAWMINGGIFRVALESDQKLSWHLVRSSGIVAYILLLASTIWGLLLSSQSVKDWSPGPVSLTLHSTISWLSLLLSLGHGLLLLFDKYFTYTLFDILVPFTGPYRPEAVGLGTLAFCLLVAISLSFPLKKRIGPANWKRLHYTSYAAFGLVSIHGLFAGTDGANLGFRLLVGGGVLVVILLLGIRVGKDQTNPSQPPRRKSRAASQTPEN